MAKERIGFIGTGIMGGPMAQNLLKAGYPVTIHNRTKAKAESLLSGGAIWADNPAEVASVSDVVITCAPDTPDVRSVLLGEYGVVEAAEPALVCVDMSTISPAATKEMGKILMTKGITLIDAPVSGGQIGAIEGQLSIMMGGPEEEGDRVR